MNFTSHPVDVLKEFFPDMSAETEQYLRSICDEKVAAVEDYTLKGDSPIVNPKGCLKNNLKIFKNNS